MPEELKTETKNERQVGQLSPIGTNLLGAYFLILPIAALWLVLRLFPEATPITQRQMLALAMLGGALGSYLHVAQSFATFVGNRQARGSWVWWYLLRTPIGASLGLFMYIVMRAGFLGQTLDISPYGVLAFSGLAGWFSKQATEKLAEVFDTMFRSENKEKYRDQLKDAARPSIEVMAPVLEAGVPVLVVRGSAFEEGAQVRVDKTMLETTFISPNELKARVPLELAQGKHSVIIVNPSSGPSEAKEIDFQTIP